MGAFIDFSGRVFGISAWWLLTIPALIIGLLLWYARALPDPYKQCPLARECAHVDGFLCDVLRCEMRKERMGK